MNYIKLSIVSILVVVGLTGCCRDKEPSSEVVSTKMATVICDRYVGCVPPESKGGFKKEICLKEVSGEIAAQLKFAKDLKVSWKMLDECIDDLQEGSCEALSGTVPPEGCKFLQQD